MGGESIQYQLNRFNNFAVRGDLGFAATGSITAFQNFLQGRVTSVQSAFGDPARNFVATDFAGFIQDDYRWSPRLTLNLGLRWKGMSFGHDKLFRARIYDPLLAAQGKNPFLIPAKVDLGGFKGTPGVKDCALNSCFDGNNFAPRVGFAWDIWGNQKTIVRAVGQRERDTYNPGNQSFEVSGQVNLAGTNEPALNIPVRLERFSGGMIDQISTDSRGRFRFPNLQRGYYRVIINAPGFYPAQQDADLQQLFRTFLLFELAREKRNALPALTDFTDIVDARVPSEAREKFVQGRTALAKKNYQDAIPYLEQANAIYPNFFEAHLLLATALIDLREWEKAEPVLQRALELKPRARIETEQGNCRE
jgi:hypothetical protein